MVTGFERRDIIQVANKQPARSGLELSPVSGVRRPMGSDFSRVGENQRKLGESISGVAESIDSLLSVRNDAILKKNKEAAEKAEAEDLLVGEMNRVSGMTEEEMRSTGNIHTRRGWKAMQGKLAGDALFMDESAKIDSTYKEMDPVDYKEHLFSKFKELDTNSPDLDPDTRKLINAHVVGMYPKLVSAQMQKYNEFNKLQTIDSARKLIVSGSSIDGPEETAKLLDPKVFNLNTKDFGKVVSNALHDDYKLGRNNVERAILLRYGFTKSGGKEVDVARVQAILSMVGEAESNNNYNAVFGGEHKNLTKMTLNDVMSFQDTLVNTTGHSPVGRYQIKDSTLSEISKELGLTGDEIFDETLQDRLGTQLLRRRGLNDFMGGSLSIDKFQENLSQEWAALPRDGSGLSYYDGDGVNKATVEHSNLIEILSGSKQGSDLYSALSNAGVSADDIPTIIRARESYTQERSAKFNAERLIKEEYIIDNSINQTHESLIATISEAKEESNYSDAWGNSTYNKALSRQATFAKENKDTQRVNTLIKTGSVAMGTKAEQQKAIDLIQQSAVDGNPILGVPGSPEFKETTARVQDQVFTFMHRNGITDERLKNQLSVATRTVIEKDGTANPTALDAYSTYRNAVRSTKDPLFAKGLLDSDTFNLFSIADSYQSTMETDFGPSLVVAATYLEKQKAAKATDNLPWWGNIAKSLDVSDKIEDKILPGLLDGFYGISDTQGQMRWSLDKEVVQKAAKDPYIKQLIKQEAASNWKSTQHWEDQEIAVGLALEQATHKVVANSEFIAGSMVYSPDGQSVASKIGMAGINNAANMVTSRIMEELGPEIYEDFNKTDIFTMSQQWYASDSGIGKAYNWIKDGPLSNPGQLGTRGLDKIGEKIHGVPDFRIMLNTTGNALILEPYTNYDRTAVDKPFILPLSKVKEAADILKTGNETAFSDWITKLKSDLPKNRKVVRGPLDQVPFAD
jgi:hypothetical protein